MIRYLGKQIATLLLLLLAGSFVIFSIVYLAPGDPLSALIGNRTPDPERVAQLRAEYHLDRPFAERYWLWLSDAFQGDFGRSTVYQVEVGGLIASDAPTTVLLIVYAEIIVVAVGGSAAAVAARFKGVPDIAVSVATSLATTVPVFVTAVVLAIVLTVEVPIFPAAGAGAGLGDRLWHLTLPAVSLAAASSALLARVGRAAMREEMSSQHLMTELARGIPAGRAFRRHILLNAAPPMLSVVGLQLPALIAGSVVVEQVFNLGGLGSLLLDAAIDHDYALVQAISLLIVVVTVLTGIVVDIAHSLIDPRVRLEVPR